MVRNFFRGVAIGVVVLVGGFAFVAIGIAPSASATYQASCPAESLWRAEYETCDRRMYEVLADEAQCLGMVKASARVIDCYRESCLTGRCDSSCGYYPQE